jgi:hypothetical protein
MKRRPDQGAKLPEQEQGKDEERLRVWEKSFIAVSPCPHLVLHRIL